MKKYTIIKLIATSVGQRTGRLRTIAGALVLSCAAIDVSHAQGIDFSADGRYLYNLLRGPGAVAASRVEAEWQPDLARHLRSGEQPFLWQRALPTLAAY